MNKVKKGVQRKLQKQKELIIKPKLEWLMCTGCLIARRDYIIVAPLSWVDPITKSVLIEWVIITINDDGNYIELI